MAARFRRNIYSLKYVFAGPGVYWLRYVSQKKIKLLRITSGAEGRLGAYCVRLEPEAHFFCADSARQIVGVGLALPSRVKCFKIAVGPDGSGRPY